MLLALFLHPGGLRVEIVIAASQRNWYQMRALIDVLLEDPKREMAARMKLHLGQAV